MSEKNPWFEPGEPARPTDIKSDKADLDMRLERKALAEGWDRTADKLDTALSQLAALQSVNESLSAELAWSENDSRDQSKEIAALREELAKYKGGCVDLSSQVREIEHKMDYWKGEGKRADEAQQRLADAERQNAVMADLLREGLEEFKEGDDWIDRVVAALNKPEEAKS